MRLLLLALSASLAGCGFGTDEEPSPPPAEILAVEVFPLPVAPGDTVTFRAVASRQVLVYSWSLSAGEQIGPARDSIRWRAPGAVGVYRHGVSLSENLFTLDTQFFDVEVIE